WNIRGLSTSDKQNEIRNFIRDESLSVCAILETHIKSKRLQDIGNRIFGNLEWYSNMQYCDKGCRIMLGWNGNTVDLRIILSAKQSMVCEIVSIGTEKSVFCTFIYAANGGMERRALWKELQIYKSIVDKKPWVLLGDMNVTLAPNEHSAGGSRMTSDLEEFKDCVITLKWRISLVLVCSIPGLRTSSKLSVVTIVVIDEAKILEDYAAAMKDEEKLLCQKAEVKWLSEGDRNNTFFHKKLSVKEAQFMVREVTDNEIKEAMFQIDGNKAPGT
nr:RNA-directed DNA polymerase, eukaryota, reverse transcriptase zinc-binding domain protein [Tanacetum cinerariifolium]